MGNGLGNGGEPPRNGSVNSGQRDALGRFVNSPGPGRPRKPEPPEEPRPSISGETPKEVLRSLLKSKDQSIALQAAKFLIGRQDAGHGVEERASETGHPNRLYTAAELKLDRRDEEIGRLLGPLFRSGARIALDLDACSAEAKRDFIRHVATVES